MKDCLRRITYGYIYLHEGCELEEITVNATQLASGDASIATAKGWVVGV